MTKHIQTCNSLKAAKRFNVRQMLRSAIAGGVVAGFAGLASAQDGLTLPSFPTDSVATSLPVSQDASFSIPVGPPQSYPSITKRVGTLLGLKKHAPTAALPQINPNTSFPSTEPSFVVTQSEPAQLVKSNSHAPTIVCSTGNNKDYKTIELSGEPIVLASADESLSEAIKDSNVVVQTALAVDEPETAESQSESTADSLSESLIDIDLPSGLIRANEVVQQHQPELVKRPPAMQLHIGGGSSGESTSTEAAPPAKTARYSLSDSSDRQPPKTVSQIPFANTMNVKIEGELMGAPTSARPPVLDSLVLRERSTFLSTDRSGETKTLSDKTPSNKAQADKAQADKMLVDKTTPTIGERLEIGLHESANVETAQPISGLSVEHPELCQVIKSGDRSVSFVGLKAGQTRVALFTKTASGERKIEIREVVIAGAENRQADMKSLATEIGRSVHRMYPNSHIEVIAEDDGLTVQGYAGTEEEAKKIIGLVRRTSLQPVVDRLATYK